MPSALRRRLLVGAALFAAGVLLPRGTTVRAHEIGTSRVSVVFHEGRTYEIELVTDAAALVEKLEISAGQPSMPDRSAADLQALLSGFDEAFRQRVRVAFGASTARPHIAYVVAPRADDGSAALASIRMSGPVPVDASQFTWTYGWTFASYALTIRDGVSGHPTTEWLEGNQRSAPFDIGVLNPPPGRLATAWRYLTLGFTHIVPNGLDHILFVVGIFLLSGRARPVLYQVTAFTVAHSITLALGLYGIVAVSPRIVEPLIAISIAYVAIENLFLSELKSWRVALVFAFGLLHGLGFSGALTELGLPRSEFAVALVTFNAGVEMGQLAVIATAFLLVGHRSADRDWYRSRVVVPASVLIACAAVFWTVQRLS